MLNNFMNEQYESNAWVYSYYYNDQEAVMDGYFPQAGINFLGGVKVKI
jgi:iron complex outermembrane receptor protein